MEKTLVSVAPSAPASVLQVRDNTNRPVKLWNPNLYYGNLHIECYYFY